MTVMLVVGAFLAIPLIMLHAAQAELEHANRIVKARDNNTTE